MALLVFADFGGVTRSRVLAYVTAAVVGVPLIVIGTFASGNVWTAVVAMALIGFGLAGMGVLGGYFVSAQTALILAFVLAVTNVATLDQLAARVTGWSVAGAIAVLAGWLIWPRSSHLALRGTAASVMRAVAAVVAVPNDRVSGEGARLEAVARQQLAGLRSGFVVAQRRPSGATRRDRALAELATDLERGLAFAAETAAVDSDAAMAERPPSFGRPSYVRYTPAPTCWRAAVTSVTSNHWWLRAMRIEQRSIVGRLNNCKPVPGRSPSWMDWSRRIRFA